MSLYKASAQSDSSDSLIGYFQAKNKEQLLTYLELNVKIKGYGFKIDVIEVEDIRLNDYNDLSKIDVANLRRRMLALDKLTPEDKHVLGLK